jgi:chromosome segregation ATPase
LTKAREELAECKTARNDAEQRAAVAIAKLEASTAAAADLRQRLDKSEALANATSAEAKTANQHYQACAARLEDAAREIENLKSHKVKTATKTTPAKVAKLPKIQEVKP